VEAFLKSSGASDPPAQAPVFVSVVMPVRNEAAFIRRSVGAVLDQDYPPGMMEVIVADGMSEDGTRSAVAEMSARHPNLRVIENPSRIVPAGLNRAILESKGDVVIRVDGHTIVARNYVSECVAALLRSGADNVGGPMRARGEGRFGRAVAAATSSPFGVGDARFHYSDDEEWVDTVYLGAWRRKALLRIGLFDEEMVRDQDDELNYRLLERGGRILLSPRIRSSYTVRGTPFRLWRQYFQYGYWKVRVMQKHPRQFRLRHLVPPAFVSALLASAVAACVARGNVFLWGTVPASYAVACVVASIAACRRAGRDLLPLLLAVYAILHLSYGLGFLTGLARFCGRWREPAACLPSRATGGDASA
jgi:succinoglycan biosynthesis protein ExoA